jgi:alkylated DNA repair dioxygenase AlkB
LELKRRVQHFGYRYDSRERAVTAHAYLGALPDWLRPLEERLAAAGFAGGAPDQVMANEYLPGQGISAHVDCVPCFNDTIVSVSLLSRCEMVFRQRPSGATRAIILEPRSALVMTGRRATTGPTKSRRARAILSTAGKSRDRAGSR